MDEVETKRGIRRDMDNVSSRVSERSGEARSYRRERRGRWCEWTRNGCFDGRQGRSLGWRAGGFLVAMRRRGSVTGDGNNLESEFKSDGEGFFPLEVVLVDDDDDITEAATTT